MKKLKEFIFSPQRPIVSYILTIHNHSPIIEEIISGIFQSGSVPFEIIVVDDNSTDKPFSRIRNISEKMGRNSPLITRILYVRNYIQRFEVACENYGLSFAQGTYICLLQADMLLKDPAFDTRLIGLLNRFPAVGAISGQGVKINTSNSTKVWLKGPGHGLTKLNLFDHIYSTYFKRNRNYKKNFDAKLKKYNNIVWIENLKNVRQIKEDFFKFGDIRYGDHRKGINQKIIDLNLIFIGRLINRGPIFMKTKVLRNVGGFNTKIFFQGFDDYEMCLRLAEQNLLVAFTPINFISEEDWGATRRKKSIWTYFLIRYKVLVRLRKRKFALLSNPSEIKSNLIGEVFVNTD
jgi:GT2 family glycosyltransferase